MTFAINSLPHSDATGGESGSADTFSQCPRFRVQEPTKGAPLLRCRPTFHTRVQASDQALPIKRQR